MGKTILFLFALAGGWFWTGRKAAQFAGFLFRQGDDLAGWAFVWANLKARRAERKHQPVSRATKGIGLFLAVVFGMVIIRRPTARHAALGGLRLIAVAAWRLLDFTLGRWKWAIVLLAVYFVVKLNAERRKYLGGEPANEMGQVRAAYKHLFAMSLPEAFSAIGLMVKVTKRTPSAGAVEIASCELPDGRVLDYGFRTRLELPAGLTPQDIMDKTSGGLDELKDPIASAVAATMRDKMRGSDEGKTIRRSLTEDQRPSVVTSTIEPIRGPHNTIRSEVCYLTVLWRSPLSVVVDFPGPFHMASTYDPAPVGLTMAGKFAGIRVRGRHTSIQGMTNSGKTSLARAAAASIGALHPDSGNPVAFIILDAKGRGGDLGALAPRSAFYASDITEIGYALEVLAEEGNRRYATMRRGEGEIKQFTVDRPEIVVWMDETQYVANADPSTRHPKPRVELDLRLEAMWSIVTRMRAVGIELVAMAQLLKAKRLDTEITSQFGNRLSTYQDGWDRARVAVPGSTAALGPHRIRKDMQGAAVGEFEGIDLPGQLTVMRSMLVTPEQSAMYAEIQAEMGCTVALPWFEAAMQVRRDRAGVAAAEDDAVAEREAQIATTGQALSGSLDEWRVKKGAAATLDMLPADVRDAVAWLETQSGIGSPFTSNGYATSRQTARWAKSASAELHRLPGATDDVRAEGHERMTIIHALTDGVPVASAGD